MRPKAVFLDIDGTLVDETGQVPSSARDAVRRARANGHQVFVCTGRSTTSIWPAILEIGFDGLVASAGGYVEVDGQVLAEHHIATPSLLDIVAFFQEHHVEYLLESNDGVFGSPGVVRELRRLILGSVRDEEMLAELERGLMGFINAIIVGADPAELAVSKVSFLDSTLTLDRIQARFADGFDIIPSTVPLFGPNSGELSMRGIHKATGMAVVCDHVQIHHSDTVAFGDGYNDREMLTFAGVGIAMDNAPDEVKACADWVAPRPGEHGIEAGFTRLGLI